MSNITKLPVGKPEGHSSPEVCLREALDAGLKDVIIIGWRENDDFYTNTNMAHGPDSLWLIRAAERRLWKHWDSIDG